MPRHAPSTPPAYAWGPKEKPQVAVTCAVQTSSMRDEPHAPPHSERGTMTKVSRGAGALSLAAALIAALTSCSAGSADAGASKGEPEIQTVMKGAHYRCDQ